MSYPRAIRVDFRFARDSGDNGRFGRCFAFSLILALVSAETGFAFFLRVSAARLRDSGVIT